MEKRSDRHIRDLVALSAFQGLDANEIGCARISMMAGSKTLPSKGRIQMSQTNYLQIATSGLQRTAGPYRSANCDRYTAVNNEPIHEQSCKNSGFMLVDFRCLGPPELKKEIWSVASAFCKSAADFHCLRERIRIHNSSECIEPAANGAQNFPDTQCRIVIEPLRRRQVRAKFERCATSPTYTRSETHAVSEQPASEFYASVPF